LSARVWPRLSRLDHPVHQSGVDALLTDYTSILTSNLLSKTYGELIKKRPVMEQTIAQLKLNMTPDQLAAMVTVAPVANTQLLV